MEDFVQKTPFEFRQPLFKICHEALSAAQESVNNSTDGVYFIDFKRFAAQKFTDFTTQNAIELPPLAIDTYLLYLYLDGQIFANQDFTKYSVNPVEGYKKWQDVKEEQFKGYELDMENKIMTPNSKETPFINFEQHMRLLKSKIGDGISDEEVAKYDEFIQHSYFLDKTVHIPKVFFCSFPRSGNTLTRKYFEQITGIVTGAAMPLPYLACFQLTILGFKGKQQFDDAVWLYKSHHPFVMFDLKDQRCSVALVCVRNPIDSISSYIQMKGTHTSSKNMKNNFSEEFPDVWDLYVQENAVLWKNQIQYFIQAAKEMKVPVYFYRYEDLLTDPETTLKGIFQFCLKMENLDGTYIERRIKQVIEMGEDGNTHYKPRAKGDFDKNSRNFTQDQLNYIGELCQEELEFCKYTQYYQEDYKSSDSITFEESNKVHMKWLIEKADEVDKIDISVNDLVDGDAKHFIGMSTSLELNQALAKVQDLIYINE